MHKRFIKSKLSPATVGRIAWRSKAPGCGYVFVRRLWVRVPVRAIFFFQLEISEYQHSFIYILGLEKKSSSVIAFSIFVQNDSGTTHIQQTTTQIQFHSLLLSFLTQHRPKAFTRRAEQVIIFIFRTNI